MHSGACFPYIFGAALKCMVYKADLVITCGDSYEPLEPPPPIVRCQEFVLAGAQVENHNF